MQNISIGPSTHCEPGGSPAKAVSDTLLMGIPSAAGWVHNASHLYPQDTQTEFEFEIKFQYMEDIWRIFGRYTEDISGLTGV